MCQQGCAGERPFPVRAVAALGSRHCLKPWLWYGMSRPCDFETHSEYQPGKRKLYLLLLEDSSIKQGMRDMTHANLLLSH